MIERLKYYVFVYLLLHVSAKFCGHHLEVFISVFNQLDAQNLFHNKFYYMYRHEIKLIVKQILCISLVKY